MSALAACRKAARWLSFWYGTLWLLYQARKKPRCPRARHEGHDIAAWEAELRSEASTP